MGDGSLERVLIGQLVSPRGEEESGRWTGTPPEQSSPPQSGHMGGLGSLGRSNSNNSMYGGQTHTQFAPIIVKTTVKNRYYTFYINSQP